ncbi:MAG: AarF/UbiB family protein, partial [Chloroflexota bacterium]|nr:AarF/UbiB family protein [Chloroflexota bacterium]
MLQTVFTQRRHAHRYRQITRTLIAHGLGGLVAPLNLGGSIRRLLRFQSGPDSNGTGSDRKSRPVHLRLALEELGPTFVKLGQILSTRADLLPPAYIAELEKLQDRVPPEPFESISVVLENELGATLTEVFAAIDPVPIAAGSIGQVHAARLPDGVDVVVKVQRPAVDLQIFEDLEILADMARLGEARSGLLKQADIVGLVKEFAWTIRAELDFRREASNAEQLGDYFANDPGIAIPYVLQEFSTR